MAYIFATKKTYATSTASTAISLPAHASGDLLLAAINNDGTATETSFGNTTFTVTIASPAVFTYSGADIFADGDIIVLTTTGALPTGLSGSTTQKYFIKNLNTGANTFEVSTTSGGSSVNTSGSQSGTHTAHKHYDSATGWEMLAFQAASSRRHNWAFKIAASSSEASPTVYGVSATWIATAITVKDAHSTPFGTRQSNGALGVSGTNWVRTAVSAATSNNSAALTSTYDGTLLLYSWGYATSGGGGFGAVMKTHQAREVDKTLSTNLNAMQVIGMVQQETAAAAPTVTCYATASQASTAMVLAIRNAASGVLQPDIRLDASPIIKFYGELATSHDSTTWQALNPNFTSSTINGKVVTTTAPSTGDSQVVTVTEAGWCRATAINSTENASLTESPAGSGIWVGGTHTITSTDMTGKVFAVQLHRPNAYGAGSAFAGAEGTLIGFSDGTNWVTYQVYTGENSWVNQDPVTAFIACGVATAYASSGSINWGAVTRLAYLNHRAGSLTTQDGCVVKNAALFGKVALTGGGANRPATFADLTRRITSWGGWKWGELQALSQSMLKTSTQIGDGTNTTYFSAEASSAEFPVAYSNTATGQIKYNATAGATGIYIKAKTGDTVNMTAGVCASDVEQLVTIDAASSTSATYSFSGMSFVGFTPTWLTGVNPSNATFSECGEIDAKGSDWTDCTVKKTTSTDAAIAFSEDGGSMTRCTIDVTGTSAAYHLELGTAVTAITLTDVTFTGTPATDKVHVRKTTGTVTITIDGTTSLVAGDVTTEGATVSIVAPAIERGQNFTGLVAGSKVKVFTSGTQTVLYGTDSSGTTFAWDDATSGSITVDYTIQQAGYLPIRVTGVVLTGAVSTGQVDTPITQVVDRAYVASSGLTYGTTAVVTVGTNPTTNPGTKTFQLTTASTGQNWYSFWIEQWIDKGDTGEALANVEFPLQANGPNSFTLRNWWEFSDGATSIAFLSRDGIRYTSAAGTRTAAWAAILTSGVPSGARVRYQQSDGGTTGNAVVTSGNMDELVQIYGDASHGNFDRTGYMVLKVQESGYDQIEADVYALYGTLEDQLYVVGLAPTANGVATGDPGLTITITDHGASPVTWNGKDFSITITDNASPSSGTDIMRELRYNFEAGGTYQGKDGFNWHDLVQTNGSDFKTVRGKIYGDTGASLKGVRVVTNGGTDPHPDFTLFTADDGTTYSPPVTSDISITSMPNAGAVPTRLQIINQTALSASAWAALTAYSLGDMRKRVAGIGTENTAGLYMRVTTAGTSGAGEPTWNTTPGGTTTDGTVTWTTYKVLFYDDDPAGTSYATTYIDGEEFLAGETVEVRFAELNGGTSFKTYDTTTIAASSGFSVAVNEESDSVYASNALDGSSYDGTFSPNYTSNYLVLDTNTDFSGKSAYAYFCYLLTTSSGMYEFWGGMFALDDGNYRIETDVLDLYFDESGGFVKQTDDVRIFRSDGLRPALDPTTGGAGIEINWRVPVSVVSTGGSALTPTESAQLMSLTNAPSAATNATAVRTELTTELGRIDAAVSTRLATAGYTAPPSAATIASQVLTDAQTTPIHSEIKKVAGSTVTGSGTANDPWGP